MKTWAQKMRLFKTYKMSIWFNMFRWTIWELWPERKKKKKKGGGVFVAVQWEIFSACVALNATSEIVIKVFPLSKGKTFLYFVWLLLLFFFSARVVKKLFDMSLSTFRTCIETISKSGFYRNDKKSFELSPLFTKTLWWLLVQNHNRYQKSDWWNELRDWWQCLMTKTKFREKCRGLRVFDLLTETFYNFATICCRDLGPSPFILSHMLYI